MKRLSLLKRAKLFFMVLNEIQKSRMKKREKDKFLEEALKEAVVFENQLFYRLIEIYEKSYPNAKLKDLFIVLLQTMDKYQFDKHPSVAFVYESIYKENKNRYDKLKQITLLTHTVNVFNISLKQNLSLPEQIREEITILALAHDFGKCPDIKKIFSSTDNEPHNHISAEFIKRVLYNLGTFDMGLIDRLYYTIRNHHKKEVTSQQVITDEHNDYFIKALNDIDYKARDLELNLLNDKDFKKEEKE